MTVKKIPDGYTAVTPHIVCAGAAEAIAFYQKAFGAKELMRMPGPDGQGLMHAEIELNGARIMMAEENPQWGSLGPKSLKGTPVTLHLYVDDTDAFIARAEKAGAKVTMPPADMFWGDRYGQVECPWGHRWSVATHTRDLTPEQMQAEMQAMFKQACN